MLTADFFYEEGDAGTHPPVLRDVEMTNVTSNKSKYGVLLRGYAHSPIQDVRITNCRFEGVSRGDVIEGVRDLAWTNTAVNGEVRNSRISL